MEYTTLGRTGLTVSQLCLGTMQFGSGEEWMISDEERCIDLVEEAIEHGINFIDTANIYSGGESERILGEAIANNREELVVASKVRGPMSDGPNGSGLSRKHIRQQIEETLDRLGTSYLDIYYIHRWDKDTPIRETLSTLHSLVEQGKVRYLGASTMASWQLMKALGASEVEGYERFEVIQPEYSLLRRHEEHNLLPVADDQELGTVTYSPLAEGFLAGKYSRGGESDGERLEEDTVSSFSTDDWALLDALEDIAAAHDSSTAQVAVAWLLNKGIDSPIIAPKTPDQLAELVDAVEIDLDSREIELLEAPLSPAWDRSKRY